MATKELLVPAHGLLILHVAKNLFAGPLYPDAGSVVGSVVGFFVTGVGVVDKALGTALQVDGLEYLLDFVLLYRSAQETRSPIPWLHVFAKVAIS